MFGGTHVIKICESSRQEDTEFTKKEKKKDNKWNIYYELLKVRN